MYEPQLFSFLLTCQSKKIRIRTRMTVQTIMNPLWCKSMLKKNLKISTTEQLPGPNATFAYAEIFKWRKIAEISYNVEFLIVERCVNPINTTTFAALDFLPEKLQMNLSFFPIVFIHAVEFCSKSSSHWFLIKFK